MATKETKKETGVAILSASSLTVNDVPSMLELVNNQIKELRGGMPDQPHTTESLSGFGRIKDIKTVQELLKAASVVMAKQKAYDDAAKKLLPKGIKKPAFKLNGSTSEQWLADIQGRIAIVANKEKLDKLNSIKKTLEENLSAEAKLANDLKKIQDLLKPDMEEE